MRIHLLGTGSADGWPNPFCHCASCEAERAAGRSRTSSAALVDGDLLIDPGPTATNAATRAGIGLATVAHVLITHGHPDHTAAIPLFPKAEVVSLAREAPLVEGREGSRGPLPRLFPVSPTGITVARLARDGDIVTLGQTQVRVFAVPGHTAGSAAYLVNEVLFVGDSADAGTSGEIQGAPWVFSDSQPENRASLVSLSHRLAADGTPVRAIAFAHSGVLMDGLGALASFARQNQ